MIEPRERGPVPQGSTGCVGFIVFVLALVALLVFCSWYGRP